MIPSIWITSNNNVEIITPDIVGTCAGKIWNTLNESEKALTERELLSLTKLSGQLTWNTPCLLYTSTTPLHEDIREELSGKKDHRA